MMHSRFRTNVLRPTANAAMGFSRIFTVRARRHYERKYKHAHHHPRRVFLFDAVLLGIVVALVGVLIWTGTWPMPTSGIRLVLSTPPVVSAAPLPFTVTLQSADGLPHQNVRVRWHLPAGAEVLEANPPIAQDGTSFIGNVTPAQEATMHMVIRTFAPQNGKAIFGFTITYDNGAQESTFFGEGIRDVVGTALTATVPSAFQVDSVVPKGATIPIRVENTSDLAIPFVFLRLTRGMHAPEEETIPLGDLAPRAVRWVYVPVPEPSPADVSPGIAPFAWIEWQVGAASRHLASGFWQANYLTEASDFPRITGNLASRTSAPTVLALSSTEHTADVLVMHPLRAEPVTRITTSSEGQFTIPAIVPTESPTHEWFVAPIRDNALGPATFGTIQTRLPFATQVRYYASTGDQLGAGPLPPRAGLETRYWVFWTIGPIDSDLESIRVQTLLPQDVTATGNITAPDGGTATIAGRTVTWSLPALGMSRASALFGFEIAITPGAAHIGQPLMLMSTSTASANDTHTRLQFTADTPPADSFLEEFSGNTQQGIVGE